MDVSKYIGLYLFKNHYCYIHGLGNLELKKESAFAAEGKLSAPKYDVILTSLGSIDDTFANFIATIEQVSISKASNAIRDFSEATKKAVANGEEVLIPSLGRFTEVNGKLSFVTDPHFKYTPEAIPALQILKRAEPEKPEAAKEDTQSGSSGPHIDWGKIAILAGIVIVIGVIAFFGIRYLNNQSQSLAPVDTVQATIQPIDTAVQVAPPAEDTTTIDTTATGTTMDANGNMSYEVIINTYSSLGAAQKRLKQLTTDVGLDAAIHTKDSATYYIVMPATSKPEDTTKVLDSLRRWYHPEGTSIYR